MQKLHFSPESRKQKNRNTILMKAETVCCTVLGIYLYINCNDVLKMGSPKFSDGKKDGYPMGGFSSDSVLLQPMSCNHLVLNAIGYGAAQTFHEVVKGCQMAILQDSKDFSLWKPHLLYPSCDFQSCFDCLHELSYAGVPRVISNYCL